jgi:hypothetical protein
MITELLQRFIAKAETHVIGEPPYGSSKEIIAETLGGNKFHKLDVKASFGMGRATAVPWIGFFDYGQKTEKGIYPVFLYFKAQRRLVLAYGLSETHRPDRQWTNLDGKKTIKEYFAQHNLGAPARYGSSFVHSVYDTTGELDEAEIERDLNTVVSEFRSIFENAAGPVSSDDDTLNSVVVAALRSSEMAGLLSDSEFRFEKARQVLEEFESLPATSDFLSQLWRNYDSVAGDFSTKLEHFPADSEEHRLLVLMGRLISYCDVNAANKNSFNEYEDKRTIARAGIRQGNWIRNLIAYKSNGNDKHGIPDIIGNALTYLKHPTIELTMLSERHREMVSRNLLKKEHYEKDRFVDAVLDYFQPYSIAPQNPENLTRVVSNVLYRFPEVKALWFDAQPEEDELDQPIVDNEHSPDLSSFEFTAIGFESDKRAILTAIRTKPFVLLAGISGTGKSRLVRTLAFMTCFDPRLQNDPTKPGNFELIAVKPNWHDSTELIGYVSRISGEKYICTSFLRFVVKAWRFPQVPFFLCLDEMNLAPVEQYFAEYLSILETMTKDNGKLRSDYLLAKSQFENAALYEGLLKDLGLAGQASFTEGLSLPSNLIVIGTVNMDETTHSFSRKVLDRAMTFEMNLVDLNAGLYDEKSDWSYPEKFVDPKSVIAEYSAGSEVFRLYEESGTVIDYLESLNEILDGTPFRIAYRVRDEFLVYCYYSSLYRSESENWLHKALDELTAMKILSRIEGDAGKTSDVLSKFEGVLNEHYTITLAKLGEMRKRLGASGYTSFWS